MTYTYPSICPHYTPTMAVDITRDKVYEGTGFCELVDKPCLKDSGMDCDTYDEWKHEQQEDIDG